MYANPEGYVEDDDLTPDGDETEPTAAEELANLPAPSTPEDVRWAEEARKAFEARDQARLVLKRTQFEVEYGKDVAGLIPDGLPPKEWKTYADRLVAFRAEAQPAQATPATGEASDEATPEEIQLAAASGSPATGTTATGQVSASEYTPKQILEIGKADPRRAQDIIAAKYRS